MFPGARILAIVNTSNAEYTMIIVLLILCLLIRSCVNKPIDVKAMKVSLLPEMPIIRRNITTHSSDVLLPLLNWWYLERKISTNDNSGRYVKFAQTQKRTSEPPLVATNNNDVRYNVVRIAFFLSICANVQINV